MSEMPEKLKNASDCSMATEIIRNRIRTTVCIDDDYKGAYGDEADNFEKNLYHKLTESGCRFVSMQTYPFADPNNNAWIQEADLLILDWKLDKSGKNDFVPALKLLDDVISSGSCSLICIYTDEREPNKIYDVLETYFRAGSYGGFTIVQDDIKPFFNGNEGELLSLAEKINGKAASEDELQKEINRIIDESPETKSELRRQKKWNKTWNQRYAEELLLFELFRRHRYDGISEVGNVEFRRVYTERNDLLAVNINNHFITIMGKNDSEGNYVKPEELIAKLSEAIYKEPNHLYHLLHLKYQTHGRIAVESRGAFVDAVPDGILKKLLNKHHQESKMLDKELREHFMEDASASMVLKADEFDPVFSETINQVHAEPTTSELTAFNAFYSQILDTNKIVRKIGFGDIFEIVNYKQYEDKGIGQYLLCITAHCDCANAKENTKNRLCFHFAIGNNVKKIDKVLENAESASDGLVDFVRKPNGDCVAIRWNDYLATLYLKSNVIEESKIKEVDFKGNKFGINYIGTLKEQYAERVANSLFSYARRVGITYLSTEKLKSEATS